MSFIRDYTEFAGNNEAPDVFHTWSAISALSSIASKRFVLDMGLFKWHPLLYILLVGPAGIRKSTAMDIALALIEELQTIPISPPSITKEALTEMLGEDDSPSKLHFVGGDEKRVNYCHMSIFCNEFITLLNAGNNSSGYVDFLTDIWNQKKFEVRTKHAGVDTIENPFINLLGCLTSDKLSNLMNEKILSSGFTRRCIFVYSETRGVAVPIPSVTIKQKEAWARCLKRGQEIQKMSGTFIMEPDTIAFYEDWYRDHYKKTESEPSRYLQDYFQTKPELMLKIAMLTTLSEQDELVISIEHIKLALDMLAQIEPDMNRAFERSGRNELSAIAIEVRDFVVKQNIPITKQKIFARFYQEAETAELKSIVSHLVETGQLKQTTIEFKDRLLTLVLPPDYVLNDDLLTEQLAGKAC